MLLQIPACIGLCRQKEVRRVRLTKRVLRLQVSIDDLVLMTVIDGDCELQLPQNLHHDKMGYFATFMAQLQEQLISLRSQKICNSAGSQMCGQTFASGVSHFVRQERHRNHPAGLCWLVAEPLSAMHRYGCCWRLLCVMML